MADVRPLVLCFGEILWDHLPDGRHPGGAPFNVAYHLAHQGCAVHLVSAVGNDAPGEELLAQLQGWELDVSGVRRDSARPTGRVNATLDAAGNARYEIVRDVAWDDLTPSPASLAAASRANALVFGSLAQRSAPNRAALESLLAALPPEAPRVFDVNLRPPFDDLDAVAVLARHATLLKLNAAEAARLASHATESAGREEGDARALAEKFGCDSVVVTAGARGAGWLRHEIWHWVPAQPVEVVDTVGAGDAFLAALLSGLLLRPTWEASTTLAHACLTGEWVAAHRGATPAYDGESPPVPAAPVKA